MKNFLGIAMLLGLTQACTTTSNLDVIVPDIKVNVDASTPATQSKSGVSMTLVKPTLEIKRFQNTVLKDPGLLQSAFNAGSGAKLYPVEQVPVYYPKDEALNFQVRVKNNLDRPLRLNGSIISIEMSEKPLNAHEATLVEPHDFKKNRMDPNKVGLNALLTGKVLGSETKTIQKSETWNGLTEEAIAELQRVVILPGKEKEITIQAPRHFNIPDKVSFTINFMDVATKVDAASNPLVKDSFLWIVNYDRTSTKKPEAAVAEDKLLNPIEVAELKQLNTIM